MTTDIERVQIWKIYGNILKISGGRSSTVRASGCGPEGCGFNSHRSPQLNQIAIFNSVFVFAGIANALKIPCYHSHGLNASIQ